MVEVLNINVEQEDVEAEVESPALLAYTKQEIKANQARDQS
jgi:hypothetical protein